MVILLHLYFSLSVVVVGTLLLVYSMCHGNLTVMRVAVSGFEEQEPSQKDVRILEIK